MKRLGIKKKPGITWITVDGKVNIFFANDGQHSSIKKIVDMMSSVLAHMANFGYVHKICHVWLIFLLISLY